MIQSLRLSCCLSKLIPNYVVVIEFLSDSVEYISSLRLSLSTNPYVFESILCSYSTIKLLSEKLACQIFRL